MNWKKEINKEEYTETKLSFTILLRLSLVTLVRKKSPTISGIQLYTQLYTSECELNHVPQTTVIVKDKCLNEP